MSIATQTPIILRHSLIYTLYFIIIFFIIPTALTPELCANATSINAINEISGIWTIKSVHVEGDDGNIVAFSDNDPQFMEKKFDVENNKIQWISNDSYFSQILPCLKPTIVLKHNSDKTHNASIKCSNGGVWGTQWVIKTMGKNILIIRWLDGVTLTAIKN
jgi:hypothetical protein